MSQYKFYATLRDGSVQWYPVFVTIDADTRDEAIKSMADENDLTVVEQDANSVWMQMWDGALVKYDVSLV
ncbi:hypothetical protein [Alicyclobacillus fastidiosus]|uniref:hypothetical protein n=1 Tax=Alicyclobacillus fastidiosus TaxID=392011 RepID=UPI0023E9DA34|nr:hypothetical protein [Alicyclobacillus fastidiosus]GMA66016.1 hypothetical protein GCM10025859_64580 [Alicyclobacillus fastidiosus]